MAVQSQYPSNVILAENHGNRNTRVIEDRGYPGSFLAKFQAPAAVMQQQQQAGVNQFHLFNQLAGGRPYAALDASILNAVNAVNAAEKQIGSRKRAREGDDLRGQWQPQQPQQQQQVLVDFQNPGTVVNPGVSTGLRLAFEDDRLRSTSPVSTSGRVETVAELSHLQQERDEIEQILKIQSEQLRTFLDEKRQRHSRELLAAAEEGFSRRLREKDAEMVKVKRQNQELLERYNQLNVELQHWQAKLRNTETMVTILRSNLHQVQQQALPLSREQSKEGCGDSEADDCASSYVDDRNDAHIRTFNENKELREQRTCRVCRSNDVSMLLLPCRHLCLCQDCEGQLVACPLCRTRKNASVQVYMS